MRLTSLSLRRYGSFDDVALQFDPRPGRINLVLAPNGAGKSVLRTAFGDLLFGIGGQTPMGFRYGYAGMQVEASGVAADGTPFRFTRRKGLKNALLGPDDAPVEPAWLERLLGKADRGLLEQLFALDTERLREGGRGLLASGGALADALLAAAGGLREASALYRSLEDERDRLAPTRKAAQRPFYMALDRWSESRRQLKNSLVRPQQWAEREQELENALARRDDANRAVAAANDALRRLERVRRVRPLLARHAMAADWLAAHPDAPILPVDLSERLASARGGRAEAAFRLEAARMSLARAFEEAGKIEPDGAVLAEASGIAGLVSAAGLARKDGAELPGLQARLGDRRQRIADHLRALGRDLPLSRAAEAAPATAQLAKLRRLIAEHAAHTAAAMSDARRLEEQVRRLSEAQRALDELPAVSGDIAALEELVSDALRDGDPARAIAALDRDLAEADAGLDRLLARLPAPLRDCDRLARLSPPDRSALERLARTRDEAEAGLGRREEEVLRLETELRTAQDRAVELEAQGVPPSRAVLAAARRRRDAGWNLVYRRAFGVEGPDSAAEQAFGDGQPLPLAFAAAMQNADMAADARLADAERAMEAETVARAITTHRAAHEHAWEMAHGALDAASRARTEWAAAVGPLGLDASAGLSDAERVMAARDSALDAVAGAARARAAVAELRGRQDGIARRLAEAMGVAAPDQPGGLQAGLDQAQSRIRQHRADRDERQRLQLAAEAARNALAEARRDEAAAADRLTRWQAEWDTVAATLGPAAGENPADLEGVVSVLEELPSLVRDTEILEAELRERQIRLAQYRSEYGALCGRLRWPESADMLAGVAELDRKQRDEAAKAKQLASLEAQRDEAAETLRGCAATLEQAEGALHAVLAAAGAATPEEAEIRIALSTDRAQHAVLLAQLAAELLAAGDGLPLDSLRGEVAAQPEERLDTTLEDVRNAQRMQAELAQDSVAAVTRLQLELQQLASDDVAMRAAADEVASASVLGQTLDDALLMQVAAGLLESALAAVQEGSDDALLRRIGSTFTTLTEDAYTGVVSREDDRGTARLAVLPRGLPEETTVEQLSEGTRDQLFLALRLVTIEDHVAGGTALPFLGDDILQSFDDRRSAAAFRALLTLSEKVQVILLSHHQHLLEVARAALPPASLHAQEISA